MAEGDNAFDFFSSDDLIGNQNIPNASSNHDFGFSNFGTCNPDGSGFDFSVGDGGNFVTFGVRTPLNVSLFTIMGKVEDVFFHKIEINTKTGSVQFVFGRSEWVLGHEDSFR